ncbi:hypothetical protein ACS0TY_016305 [Phlomoides rotata]
MVEEDVPIERVVRETLHHFHGSDHHMLLEKIARKMNKLGGEEDGGVGIGERGVDGDLLQEDKLERFKVKTVNAIGAGVVREEE